MNAGLEGLPPDPVWVAGLLAQMALSKTSTTERDGNPALLTMAQASILMGLGRSQARYRLTRFHEQNPKFGLLVRPVNDGGRSNYRVNPSALSQILRNQHDVSMEVGLVESEVQTLRQRIGRLERQTARLVELSGQQTLRIDVLQRELSRHKEWHKASRP